MSHVLANRVKESTATTGTGTLTLLGAATGYQAFSAIGNANTCYYTIAHQTLTEWEVGVGTYTAAGTLLSRDTVIASSAAGAKVTFSTGIKDVFVDAPTPQVLVARPDNKTPLLGALVFADATEQSTAAVGFSSGTAMMFVQTAAPTGWTKSTTHNNKALRVVSGAASSGGTVAFTTAFGSQAVSGSVGSTTATGSISTSTSVGSTTATGTVGGTTLAESQIPSHVHSVPGNTSNSSGSPYRILSNTNNTPNVTNNSNATGGSGSHNHSLAMDAHSHSASSSSSLTMNAHNHTFTGTAIDLTVQYVDVIIATKD